MKQNKMKMAAAHMPNIYHKFPFLAAIHGRIHVGGKTTAPHVGARKMDIVIVYHARMHVVEETTERMLPRCH